MTYLDASRILEINAGLSGKFSEPNLAVQSAIVLREILDLLAS
jgi:hypothetical protein